MWLLKQNMTPLTCTNFFPSLHIFNTQSALKAEAGHVSNRLLVHTKHFIHINFTLKLTAYKAYIVLKNSSNIIICMLIKKRNTSFSEKLSSEHIFIFLAT